MNKTIQLLLLPAVLCFLSTACALGDPAAEIASFSAFKEVDLSKLMRGEIMSIRSPAMSFQRGLGVQFCYILPLPVQSAADLQKSFNGAGHSELKVFLHSGIGTKPGMEDFAKLKSAPGNSSVKSFVEATEHIEPGHATVQISAAEAKGFTKGGQDAGGAFPGPVYSFWSSVLQHRAAAYVSGGIGREPAYADGTQAAEDAAELLQNQGKIRSRFSALAERLNGASGASLYWEMFDVEGQAAVTLGAFYSHPNGQGWQGMDVNYYSSGGYYVYLTLFELWPITVGNQPATLVWRGDMLSAAELGRLHGVERMGSGSAMMKDVQKTIKAVMKDARH